LFTSMNHDGTKSGYAVEEYRKLSSLVPIPIIASGGAGSVSHIVEVLQDGCADAALAASIFHYNEIPIPILKKELIKNGITTRIL
ncbi:MAG: HisA/HisF-related TIM barrel protein, partial [Rikenellaceae bacterium]